MCSLRHAGRAFADSFTELPPQAGSPAGRRITKRADSTGWLRVVYKPYLPLRASLLRYDIFSPDADDYEEICRTGLQLPAHFTEAAAWRQYRARRSRYLCCAFAGLMLMI
jgi:hypothetical protein